MGRRKQQKPKRAADAEGEFFFKKTETDLKTLTNCS